MQMSLVSRKRLDQYWQGKHADPIIKSTLGRDQWKWIYRALYHLSDDTMDYVDNIVQTQFKNIWSPDKRVSVDETMRKFKGRSKHKVYAPDKPTKRGLKYYLAVDSRGFCIWYKPYRTLPASEKEEKVTFKILKDVMDILPSNSGTYYLYADNYYGSLEIAEEAVRRQLRFTIGCRSNRPSDLFANGLDTDLQPYGDLQNFNFWVKEDHSMVAMSWRDKNLTRFLSNIASTEIIDTKQKSKGELQAKLIPKIVNDYTTKGMGHVDQFNAKLVLEAKHKNFSWRRAHFLTSLRIVLVNCYIYWKELARKNTDLSQNYFVSLFVKSLEHFNKEARSKQLKQERQRRWRESKKNAARQSAV